jgi:hypothetical protein
MADPVFKVVQLDDGSITVEAPASAFPDKGYFTLYDKSASAKGECCVLDSLPVQRAHPSQDSYLATECQQGGNNQAVFKNVIVGC